jgi:hypothetical protein
MDGDEVLVLVDWEVRRFLRVVASAACCSASAGGGSVNMCIELAWEAEAGAAIVSILQTCPANM